MNCMYTLACKDVGTPECPYVSEASSAEEAVQMMKEHARGIHGEKIAGKSDEELSEMMEPAVREA